MATFLWLVLPYLALACSVLGHVWRWRHDQFGWRTFNTPIVRTRVLRLGSPLVHSGLTAVVIGHLLGLLVPRSWTAAVGVTDATYGLISVIAGTLAGITMLAGLMLLAARRIVDVPLRRTTSAMDVAMYAVLGAVVLLGLVATVGVQVFGAGHDYRQSVAVWWRGIFLFQPDPTLMVGTPLVLQLHTIVALGLLAIWPFTRLVHAWAVVIGILWQPSKTRPRPSSALDS